MRPEAVAAAEESCGEVEKTGAERRESGRLPGQQAEMLDGPVSGKFAEEQNSGDSAGEAAAIRRRRVQLQAKRLVGMVPLRWPPSEFPEAVPA